MTRCRQRYDCVRERLHRGVRAIESKPEEFSATDIRSYVNDLITRLALVQLTLAKGSGYVRDHRAQRLCREAMFFLVWSAPTILQQRTLERILEGWPTAGSK